MYDSVCNPLMVSSGVIIMEIPGSHVPKTRVLLAEMTVVIIPLVFFVGTRWYTGTYILKRAGNEEVASSSSPL